MLSLRCELCDVLIYSIFFLLFYPKKTRFLSYLWVERVFGRRFWVSREVGRHSLNSVLIQFSVVNENP